jgi:hypothetical protein
MLHRRSEALVTEFLGDALALGALGVPELEAMIDTNQWYREEGSGECSGPFFTLSNR